MNYTPLDLRPHTGIFSKVIAGSLVLASFAMVSLSVFLSLPANQSSRANTPDSSLVAPGGSALPGAGTNPLPNEPELICPSNYEKISENQSCSTDLKVVSSANSTIRCCAVASSLPPVCPDGGKPLSQADLRALVNVSSQCPNPAPAQNSDGTPSSSLFCCPRPSPAQCVEPDYAFSDTIKCLDCDK